MRKRYKTSIRFVGLIISILIGVLLILCIEAGLRISGYGFPSSFYLKRTIAGKEVYINNIFYTQKFFTPALIRTPMPMVVDREKPANTIRIAIVGESAALGDPDYSFGFGRILRVMLEDVHPDLNFEIINTSITAINSHVILPIVKETSRKLKPDVFLIYMGNNEVIGPYGPNSGFSGFASNRRLIKMKITLNSTRLGMLARKAAFSFSGKTLPDEWDGMEMFLNYKMQPGDKLFETVQSSFRANLEEITQVASKHAKVILSNVAVNLRDCPPFYSMHDAALNEIKQVEFDNYLAKSLAFYHQSDYDSTRIFAKKALAISPVYAKAHYLLAEAFVSKGDIAGAEKHYKLALDYDALKFRTDNSMNAIIESVYQSMRENDNVSFVDAVSRLSDSSYLQIPGSDILLEHVHFNFFGHYVLASAFKEKIEESLGLPRSPESVFPMGYYQDRLAYTPYEAYKIHRDMLSRLDKAPFNAQLNNDIHKAFISDQISQIKAHSPREVIYLNAMGRYPDDWIVHSNYVLYLTAQGIYNDTVLQLLQKIQKMVPQNPVIEFNTGYYYERNGDTRNALRHYERALKIFPYYNDAKEKVNRLRNT